jgi:hypothetical protein
MNKEIILVVAAAVFLLFAFYAIGIIHRLPVSRRKKQLLYWTSLIVPVLGVLLARYYHKKANGNG